MSTTILGGESSVACGCRMWAKCPGGELSRGQNVQGVNRPGGETSRGRIVLVAKRPGKRPRLGAKRPGGEPSKWRNVHKSSCHIQKQ